MSSRPGLMSAIKLSLCEVRLQYTNNIRPDNETPFHPIITITSIVVYTVICSSKNNDSVILMKFVGRFIAIELECESVFETKVRFTDYGERMLRV